MQLTNVKISRDDARWETEIKAEIPAEVLATYRDTALKEIQKTAKLDGFRPGNAPLDRIVQVYGESAVMRHAAEMAIENELPILLAKESLGIVEAPRVTTDTPESGKPLVFTARAPNMTYAKNGDLVFDEREFEDVKLIMSGAQFVDESDELNLKERLWQNKD